MTEVQLETIVEPSNMRRAYRAVLRNRGAPGVDRLTTGELGAHIRAHWPSIRGKLCEGRYRPGRLRGVRIAKASGGQRLLGIPTVTDRLIQQAVQQRLTALWDPTFSVHSYGYRPGRSAHDAIRAAQGYVLEGKSWVVDLDIEAFFDNVNHDLLMHKVAQTVRDKRVLRLIGDTLRADLELDGQRHKRTAGTPQGGPLSPVLANLYLDALDRELESRGLSFCRYADDLTIYVTSERSAERILASISAWVEKHLKLKVNVEKSGTGRPWKRSFLGYLVHEDGRLETSDKSIKRYKAQVRALWDARQSLTSQALVKQWRAYLRGWWNYFKLSSDDYVLLSSWTRRHMRKCFWQRWHSKVGRRRKLQRLGVPAWLLGRVDYYAGAWRAARHLALHRALGLKMLKRYGLWTPSDFASAQR